MSRGDSFEMSASKKVRGELGLNISPERFAYVSTYSTAFKERQLPPQENGTHTVNALMLLTVTPEERHSIDKKLTLDGEHERADWFNLDAVSNPADDRFPAALHQMATDVYEHMTHPDIAVSDEEVVYRAVTQLAYLRSKSSTERV